MAQYMETFGPVVYGTMEEIYQTFLSLKEKGADSNVVDTSVDFATEADKRLTDAVVAYLDGRPETYNIMSEEGSREREEADYYMFLDEIDGTFNMMTGRGKRPFGPIFAISDVEDPNFDDVQAAAYLHIPSGILHEAYRDEGAYITEGWVEGNRERSRIRTSGRESIRGEVPTTVMIDLYMLSGVREEFANAFGGDCHPGDHMSTAENGAMVATGACDLFFTGDQNVINEGKRKTAEELAGLYLLINEAGGVVTNFRGEDIGDRRIGLDRGNTFNVICAATPEIAAEASQRIAPFLNKLR